MQRAGTDFYAVLGVERGAFTRDVELKRAYRKLAMQHRELTLASALSPEPCAPEPHIALAHRRPRQES